MGENTALIVPLSEQGVVGRHVRSFRRAVAEVERERLPARLQGARLLPVHRPGVVPGAGVRLLL